jgi:pyrimidine-specific ribonucleoside hydrolase
MNYLFSLLKTTLCTVLMAISVATHAAKNQRAFIIDTDLGIDDLIAITYFLKQENIAVQAITVECDGISHCKPASKNLDYLLHLLHRDNIPIGYGSDKPLQSKAHLFPTAIQQINETLAGTPIILQSPILPRKKAVDLLATTLRNQKKPIEILALGPLTNLATTLKKHPALKAKIKKIYFMGGAVHVPGNVNDFAKGNANLAAEWNVYLDAFAAAQLFQSGIPIVLIPLDLCNQLPLSSSYDKALQHKKTPAAKFIYSLLVHNRKAQPKDPWYFWDPLAAVVATHEEIATCNTELLRVSTSDDRFWGATQVDKVKGSPIQVCTRIDRKEFKSALLDSIN